MKHRSIFGYTRAHARARLFCCTDRADLDYHRTRALAIRHRIISRSGIMRRLIAMDEPQIYSRLSEIFKDVFDEDSIQLRPSLSANDVEGWDSLTHIRLIMSVEKAFKIKFSTSQVRKLENVGNLVSLIQARV
jgi:acyl carrier protein